VSVYRIALVRESSAIESTTATPIQKSSEAAEVLRPLFAELDREQFVVLMLDAQHRPLGMSVISIGSLTASIVHPRLCFAKHNLGWTESALRPGRRPFR
jgi:DNA repair protein RadC